LDIKKPILQTCVTCCFFANDEVWKSIQNPIKKHLKKELLPEVDRRMQKNTWIKDFLKERLNTRFIKHIEWPHPSGQNRQKSSL